MTAATPDKCPTCGSLVARGSPAGQCVRCALELALSTGSAASTASALPLKQLGDYELISEIARGGMGAVWRARQVSLNRMVALKLLLEGKFATEAAVKRFEYEAEAAANLDHPNIVPIYEVGQQDGWPFIAMKLIEGISLAQWMEAANATDRPPAPRAQAASPSPPLEERAGERRPVAPTASIQLMAKVARAVHFAHLRGILHRDLKPSNILLDAAGEPHITDFGLAKGIEADGRLTLTGAILGSPFYMAPEQATGNSGQLSVAADIYSLGVILYELLTQRLPFQADTPVATLKLALETEPPRPRTLQPAINRDLETICLKCLAKDPAARYETAALFAADLEHWLRREPILARPAGALERTWKWVRRHPLKAAFATVALLAVLGPLLTTFYLYNFVLPSEARAHPIVGLDQNINGYALTFDTGRVDRATMNFDAVEFGRRRRQGCLYFTNLPPEALAWASHLSMQIVADIPAAPDLPRSPVVHPGQWFPVDAPGWRDRAYYICPFGWRGEDILARAPQARLILTITRGDPLSPPR